MPPNSPTDHVDLIARSNELLTVIAKALLAPMIERELSDPKLAKLYELTGRDMPVQEIARVIRASATTISDAWQRWERLGLLVKDGRRYRKIL